MESLGAIGQHPHILEYTISTWRARLSGLSYTVNPRVEFTHLKMGISGKRVTGLTPWIFTFSSKYLVAGCYDINNNNNKTQSLPSTNGLLTFTCFHVIHEKAKSQSQNTCCGSSSSPGALGTRLNISERICFIPARAQRLFHEHSTWKSRPFLCLLAQYMIHDII